MISLQNSLSVLLQSKEQSFLTLPCRVDIEVKYVMFKNVHSFTFFLSNLQVQRILIDGTIQTASKKNYILRGGIYTNTCSYTIVHMHVNFLNALHYSGGLVETHKCVGLKDALCIHKHHCP